MLVRSKEEFWIVIVCHSVSKRDSLVSLRVERDVVSRTLIYQSRLNVSDDDSGYV